MGYPTLGTTRNLAISRGIMPGARTPGKFAKSKPRQTPGKF